MKIHSNIGKRCLRGEYDYWLDNNVPFLALHALQDLVYFFPEEKNPEVSKELDRLKTKIKIKSKKM
jgi:hypothetical protein